MRSDIDLVSLTQLPLKKLMKKKTEYITITRDKNYLWTFTSVI